MEVNIDKDWLKALHEILVLIYETTEDPIASAIPLVQDYDESLISICVERHNTKVFGKIIYSHTLQKAAVLMHSIISFHPFVDGNKRTALLTTDFYLSWNGYDLIIPNDADLFTISIAKGEKSLNDILEWLKANSKRTPYTVLSHWLCVISSRSNKKRPIVLGKIKLPDTMIMPVHALLFFRNKIIESQHKKAEVQRKANHKKINRHHK
jgi:death-on-curing protein